MTEPILADATGRIVGSVISQAAKPAVDAILHALARRGVGKTDVRTAIATSAPPRSSVLSLLYSLPKGLNQVQVDEMIASPRFVAMIQLLLAAHLTEAPENYRSILRMQTATFIRQVFRGDDFKGANRYSQQLFDLFDESCSSLARNVIDRLNRPNEAHTWAYESIAMRHLRGIEQSLELISGNASISDEDVEDWRKKYVTAFDYRHSKIELPDLAERRRVPRADLYINPLFQPENLSASRLKEARSDNLASGELTDTILAQMIYRTVILGDPGAGKSTVSAWLADYLHRRRGLTPFIVNLKNVLFSHGGFSVIDEIVERLHKFYNCPAHPNLIRRLMREGRAVVVFDGLDELEDGRHRLEAVGVIDQLAATEPLTRIVVTSRRVGYRAARLDQDLFDEFSILAFDPDRSHAYVTKWLTAQDEVPAGDRHELIHSFIKESESISDLVSNPLLLAFICILYRGHRTIPRRRVDLYRSCVELLLYAWDKARGITTKPLDLRPHLIVLNAIGHAVMTSRKGSAGLTVVDVEALGVSALLEEEEPDSKLARKKVGELLALCRGRGWIFTDVGLDGDGTELFAFTHASFAEYFAACHLDRIIETPELLADALLPYVSTGRWEVLGQMCISLRNSHSKAGSSRAITQLLRHAVWTGKRGVAQDEDFDSRLGQKGLQARAAVVDFVIKASDSLPLSGPAIGQLCDLALDQFADEASTMLGFLLNKHFKHRDNSISYLTTAFQEAIDTPLADPHQTWASSSVRAKFWVATHLEDIARLPGSDASPEELRAISRTLQIPVNGWEEFAQQDELSFAISVQHGRKSLMAGNPTRGAVEAMLGRLYRPHGQPRNGIGPRSILAWIVSCFGGDAGTQARAHASRVLTEASGGILLQVFDVPRPAAIGVELARTFDGLSGLSAPSLPYRKISERLAGHRPQVLAGWMYLMMSLLELHADLALAHPVRFIPDDLIQFFDYYSERELPGWHNVVEWQAGRISVWEGSAGELLP